jgi:hypothetical protein
MRSEIRAMAATLFICATASISQASAHPSVRRDWLRQPMSALAVIILGISADTGAAMSGGRLGAYYGPMIATGAGGR